MANLKSARAAARRPKNPETASGPSERLKFRATDRTAGGTGSGEERNQEVLRARGSWTAAALGAVVFAGFCASAVIAVRSPPVAFGQTIGADRGSVGAGPGRGNEAAPLLPRQPHQGQIPGFLDRSSGRFIPLTTAPEFHNLLAGTVEMPIIWSFNAPVKPDNTLICGFTGDYFAKIEGNHPQSLGSSNNFQKTYFVKNAPPDVVFPFSVDTEGFPGMYSVAADCTVVLDNGGTIESRAETDGQLRNGSDESDSILMNY
jgi:hypothetical protein